MSKNTKAEANVAALISLALAGPVAIWHGFVATKLWSWFVVPMLGVKPLPIAAAIGISTLLSFWVKPWPKSDDNEDVWESLGRSVAASVVWPPTALLIGWIAQHWMP